MQKQTTSYSISLTSIYFSLTASKVGTIVGVLVAIVVIVAIIAVVIYFVKRKNRRVVTTQAIPMATTATVTTTHPPPVGYAQAIPQQYPPPGIQPVPGPYPSPGNGMSNPGPGVPMNAGYVAYAPPPGAIPATQVPPPYYPPEGVKASGPTASM